MHPSNPPPPEAGFSHVSPPPSRPHVLSSCLFCFCSRSTTRRACRLLKSIAQVIQLSCFRCDTGRGSSSFLSPAHTAHCSRRPCAKLGNTHVQEVGHMRYFRLKRLFSIQNQKCPALKMAFVWARTTKTTCF